MFSHFPSKSITPCQCTFSPESFSTTRARRNKSQTPLKSARPACLHARSRVSARGSRDVEKRRGVQVFRGDKIRCHRQGWGTTGPRTTPRARLRRAVPSLCPPGRWAHAEQVARTCYRRRNALPARDLVVDLMVADIARSMNTGAFPRTSTPRAGRRRR